MHRLFQPSKNSRDCTQTVRSGSFSMVGARFGVYCNQKFRDRPGCGGGTGQKKESGTVHGSTSHSLFCGQGRIRARTIRNFKG
mgnify:FL=1